MHWVFSGVGSAGDTVRMGSNRPLGRFEPLGARSAPPDGNGGQGRLLDFASSRSAVESAQHCRYSSNPVVCVAVAWRPLLSVGATLARGGARPREVWIRGGRAHMGRGRKRSERGASGVGWAL